MQIQGVPFSPVPQRPAKPYAPAAAAPDTTSPDAPGDASLWSLLTEDERTFFTEQANLGPVTYGRPRSTNPPAPIGQRLDLRA